MSANEHRRIRMVHSTWVYVCMWKCVCMCVHLLVLCLVNAYIILLRPCNQWKSQFHVSSTHNQPPITLWKILGTVPCSLFPLRLGRRFTAYEQGPSQRTLPALFGQLSPMSWLPAIYSQKAGRTLCGFWPLWQIEAPGHLPGSCLYHTVSFGQSVFFPLFWQMGLKSQKWEWVSESFHKTLFGLWDAKPNLLKKKSH